MGYTGVFTFGDSLVDAGNALGLAKTYDYFPFTSLPDGAPTSGKGYHEGRFTDGWTFADLLSNKYLGVVTKPVFPFGYDDPFLGISFGFFSDPSGKNLNFAYGGGQIRQGAEAVPDLDDQTDAYRDAVDGKADPNALHLFVFGANDVHDWVPRSGEWLTRVEAEEKARKAADEYIEELLQLVDIGARNILMLGVPDIGIQPDFNGSSNEALRRSVATEYSAMLDSMIQARLGQLAIAGVNFDYVSFTGMAASVLGTMVDLYGQSEIYPLNYSNEVFVDRMHPSAQLNALATGYLLDILNGTTAGEAMKLAAPDYSLDGRIAAKGEVDTITVSLVAGATYTFHLLGISSLGGDAKVLADPLLRVTGPTGALARSDDDGGLGLDSNLTFTADVTGDYVFQLGGVGAMTGTYRFAADGSAPGDSVYAVSHAGAVVLERAGEGYDTVKASVSYALGTGVSIEKLMTSADGKGSINLTGNELDQRLVGNAGANILDGKNGSDQLSGLAGKDVFQFSSTIGADVDRIMDFNVRDDTIWLDDAIFGGLAVGALLPGAFAKGSAATQADDRIVFDPGSGNLYFDPDGAGGAAQILFANVGTGLKLTSADFIVV